MRNPPWTRDELILALDLYFCVKPNAVSESHPEVVELSEILNRLPIHAHRPDPERFRNPSGVRMKLSNFLRLDPSYRGAGLQAGSKGDEAVWNEFVGQKERLRKTAERIRSLSQSPEELAAAAQVQGEEAEAAEGRLLLRLHKLKERSASLTNKKKAAAFRQSGRLQCEVCGFDFKEKYGEIGDGFIECHHNKPLSELEVDRRTRLTDLSLVCSNCHRMLHRRLDLSLEGLRACMGRRRGRA